jgi:hypothetical protein
MEPITDIGIDRRTSYRNRSRIAGMSTVEKAIALPVRRFVPNAQLAFGAAIAVSGLSVLAGKLIDMLA